MTRDIFFNMQIIQYCVFKANKHSGRAVSNTAIIKSTASTTHVSLRNRDCTYYCASKHEVKHYIGVGPEYVDQYWMIMPPRIIDHLKR